MTISIPENPSKYWAALDRTRSDAAPPFDAFRHQTPEGREWWSARDLQPLLGYRKWEDFANAIDRARLAAHNSGHDVAQNFPVAQKVTASGPTAKDYHLSRYACYLTALNGDPRKAEVAAAQTYFVIKTREAETTAPALTGPELVAAALIEANKMLTAKDERIAELEPKADLAESYLTAQGGARLVRQVAKTFGLKETDLRRFLVDEGLIYMRHSQCGDVQYDHYAQFAHYFLPRETVVQHQFGSCSHYTLLVLPHGVELIGKRLRAKGILS